MNLYLFFMVFFQGYLQQPMGFEPITPVCVEPQRFIFGC